MATISVSREGKKKLVSITGDLVLENMPELKEQLLSKKLTKKDTVDLGGVEKFDLPGLQLLYALAQEERGFEYGENGPRFAKMALFAGFPPLPGSAAGEA